MYETIRQSLAEWAHDTSERQKLQHVYIIAVIVLLVVAGLAGLVNYQMSQQILGLAFIAGIVFLVNLVVWALLQSLILLPLDKTARAAKPRTRKPSQRK